jgi:hypothetical protein
MKPTMIVNSYLPKNAFEYFNLSSTAQTNEIMLAVMNKIKSAPEKMAEVAEYQKLLLNPETRFLIQFIYYFDSKTDFDGVFLNG